MSHISRVDVRQLGAADLQWPFHGKGEPQYRLRTSDEDYASLTAVDPFPCYSHDPELVEQLLAHCQHVFPLDPAPVVFVLGHEPHGRTNGWAESKSRYDEDRNYLPAPGHIVLAGKRIPLHPAMTRYLVAHEYGHHVQYQLERARGEEPGSDKLVREYAQLRGLTERPAYGGGTWHLTPGEVFANDFRILVADAEPEFWPHPDVARPEASDAAIDFWAQAWARAHRDLLEAA